MESSEFDGEQKKNEEGSLPLKPEKFAEMVAAAKKLCTEFTFVRVDLYDIDGRILLGELTFTPSAGMANYYTSEAQILLGSMLELPCL